MKRFLAAIFITCVLSVSALAGDIPISGSPAPATSEPTTSAQASETAPGDIPSDGRTELSSEALSALLSVLSFLAA